MCMHGTHGWIKPGGGLLLEHWTSVLINPRLPLSPPSSTFGAGLIPSNCIFKS